MKNLSTEQQAALDLAVEIMHTPAQELMDPDDCGEENCVGCESRHAVAELIQKDPARLTKILTEAKPRFEELSKELKALEDERDAVFAKKDAFDTKVEASYTELHAVLTKPPPELLN